MVTSQVTVNLTMTNTGRIFEVRLQNLTWRAEPSPILTAFLCPHMSQQFMTGRPLSVKTRAWPGHVLNLPVALWRVIQKKHLETAMSKSQLSTNSTRSRLILDFLNFLKNLENNPKLDNVVGDDMQSVMLDAAYENAGMLLNDLDQELHAAGGNA